MSKVKTKSSKAAVATSKVLKKGTKTIIKKTSEADNDEKYIKLDPITHILKRPETYIDTTVLDKYDMYIADDLTSIYKKEISMSPGFLRLFIESISNAIDNAERSRGTKTPCTQINIKIDQETGETSIWNDGEVIPVKINKKEGIYNHSLIFGHLLSGSNYDDTKKKYVSGKNGYGEKLVNIFSSYFKVRGFDPETSLLLTQEWTNNMQTTEEPTIIEEKFSFGFTEVIWKPDFVRFGLKGYTKDLVSLIRKYAIDTAMLLSDVKVYFNEELITTNSMLSYAMLYDKELNLIKPKRSIDKEKRSIDKKSSPAKSKDKSPSQAIASPIKSISKSKEKSPYKATLSPVKNKSKDKQSVEKKDETDLDEDLEEGNSEFNEEFIHIKSKPSKEERYEVLLLPNNNNHPSFQHVSFVNGIYTKLGGKHVKMWMDSFLEPLVEKLNKKEKNLNLKVSNILSYFKIFVSVSVADPNFDGQSKNELKGPNVTTDVKKTDITKISHWMICERILDFMKLHELTILKKTEKKSRGFINIPNYNPANNSTDKNLSSQCILALVEGLSARQYIVAGIEKGVFGKEGRDWFGILPLKGKFLNTRNAKITTIAKNVEISNIVNAVGLKYDVDYEDDNNFKKLRYGKIMFCTDSDSDGTHIEGLLLNFLHTLFPSLLKRKESFIISMITPIVRVFKGKGKDLLFYDEYKFKQYSDNLPKQLTSKQYKYYKGLGTMKIQDVGETFGEKMIEYQYDENVDTNMIKVFHNKYADQRKQWLLDFKRVDRPLANKALIKMNISDFINDKLIEYSIDSCTRSIPCIIDGLKDSQRKVLYAVERKKLSYEGQSMKVSQLAGATANLTDYSHGENNINGVIEGLANCYIGSNNIPLLYRDGQFGSRLAGGKDAADGRYTFTKMDMLTKYIFREEDRPILEKNTDAVEYKYYVPILPMILINGADGIGTGSSTTIPCFNPKDIIECVKLWIENDGDISEIAEARSASEAENGVVISKLPELTPWYRDFKGTIEKEKNKDGFRYVTKGVLNRLSDTSVIITELPIGMWTDDVCEILKEYLADKSIKKLIDHSNIIDVNYTIEEADDGFSCSIETLKLHTFLHTSNMVLFTEEGVLHNYKNPEKIIDNHCRIRFEYYTKRKNYYIKEISEEITELENKSRFIKEIVAGTIDVRKMDDSLMIYLEKQGYKKLKKGKKEKKEVIEADDTENNDEEVFNENEVKNESVNGESFNYLVNMPIKSLNKKNIIKLENDFNELKKQLEYFINTSEKQMWLKEIDEFEEKYDKWLKILDSENNKLRNTKRKKKDKENKEAIENNNKKDKKSVIKKVTKKNTF